jgi:hypothetical protein
MKATWPLIKPYSLAFVTDQVVTSFSVTSLRYVTFFQVFGIVQNDYSVTNKYLVLEQCSGWFTHELFAQSWAEMFNSGQSSLRS